METRLVDPGTPVRLDEVLAAHADSSLPMVGEALTGEEQTALREYLLR